MIKSDIIKTDEFFVGKKGEKKMYLINKLDFLFDQLHRQVDAAIKEDRKSAFREKRNSDRREYRRWMRKHCFEVYLFDDDFDYKSIELIDLPPHITKKDIKHNFILVEGEENGSMELRGYYRGKESEMLEFVNLMYER